jgi:FKBP-type peptidyl-prolyl cis-trans isomerase
MKSLFSYTFILFAFTFFFQNCRSKSAVDTEILVNREDQILRDYLAERGIPAEKLSSGMYYQRLQQGTGDKPTLGDTVRVHYTGNIIYSYVFDSSRFRDSPFQFVLGATGSGGVISGWTIGVQEMRLGERGIFFMPSYLGYGTSGSPQDRTTGLRSIPPNSILIFDIELLEIRKRR